MIIKRGEIYIAELKGFGSEQSGTRPVLIIQNDKGNTYSNTTVVVPITSKSKKYSTTHVDIDCLKYPSTVLCEHIRVLDKTKLIRKVADITVKELKMVEQKVLLNLDIF